MKQVEIKKVMIEKPSAIICDVCGERYELDDYIESVKADDFLQLSFRTGYFSPFGDMNIVECDICPDCLLDMIGDYARVKSIYEED